MKRTVLLEDDEGNFTHLDVFDPIPNFLGPIDRKYYMRVEGLRYREIEVKQIPPGDVETRRSFRLDDYNP